MEILGWIIFILSIAIAFVSFLSIKYTNNDDIYVKFKAWFFSIALTIGIIFVYLFEFNKLHLIWLIIVLFILSNLIGEYIIKNIKHRKMNGKDKERTLAENIITTLHNYYNVVRSEFPNKREVFYLAFTWTLYAKNFHKDQYADYDFPMLFMLSSGDVQTHSYLDPPDSIDAFSYYLIHKEKLSIEDEYEQKYSNIMMKYEIRENEMNNIIEENTKYLIEESHNLDNIDDDKINSIYDKVKSGK